MSGRWGCMVLGGSQLCVPLFAPSTRLAARMQGAASSTHTALGVVCHICGKRVTGRVVRRSVDNYLEATLYTGSSSLQGQYACIAHNTV
jgi:hypothetical protein